MVLITKASVNAKGLQQFHFPSWSSRIYAESKLHTICCCTYVMGSKEMKSKIKI